jgi:hypothetical protein
MEFVSTRMIISEAISWMVTCDITNFAEQLLGVTDL